jgi:hypothetical protein
VARPPPTIGAVAVDAVGRSGGSTPAVTDDTLVAFARAVELAAVALYAQAAVVLGSPAAVSAVDAFSAHHRAHAQAFGQLAGPAALGSAPTAVLAALAPVTLLVSERDGLTFLHALESRLAATHHYLLGRFTTVPTISLTAVTLPVECQHAVVLGTLLSLPLAQLVPTVEGDDGHLVPEQYLLP